MKLVYMYINMYVFMLLDLSDKIKANAMSM